MDGPEFKELISTTGYLIETAGVFVIAAGIVSACARYALRYFRSLESALYQDFRREIGRTLIVGLEFLVAGDIIRTVVIAHSITDVAALGLMVVIRTVLVFTIHLEVEGHWPWDSGGVR
jgi:uncharacterized membrane protein